MGSSGSAETQGRLWGAAAREWAELNEPFSVPLYETVLDAIAVRPGMALLDAGCGSGYALMLAAKRGASVSGLDASARMLDVARERVTDGDLRLGDLERLPFPDETFDAITAFNSVQYVEQPTAALSELRRVGKPNGPIGLVTWGPPERCETSPILAALGSLLPPPPPGASGPFAFSEPGRLEALVETAGLVPEYAGDIEMSFRFDTLDAAVRAQSTSGPARMAIEHAGEQATRDALAAGFAHSRQPDGTYRQTNIFRYLIARVPA